MTQNGWATNLELIRQRYRWIAGVYPAFEVLLGVPPGARTRAVERLGLAPGARVVEVGCGTGRNLSRLEARVGPSGHIVGVDITPEMLSRSQRLSRARGWTNVDLIEADARTWSTPEPVDAVLFCFSYSVLPMPMATLENAWRLLKPGGRLVVLDGALPTGLLGRLALWWGTQLSRLTVLGNPNRRPIEDLRQLTGEVGEERLPGGWYAISHATKPGASPTH